MGTNHLKIQFQRDSRTLSAIGFNFADCSGEMSANRRALYDVAFVPTLNSYWSPPRVEMEIKDLKVQQPPGTAGVPPA